MRNKFNGTRFKKPLILYSAQCGYLGPFVFRHIGRARKKVRSFIAAGYEVSIIKLVTGNMTKKTKISVMHFNKI